MLCRAVLQDSHNFGMGQALMARSNVAKTLLNKQHAPFRSLNRRGEKCLFSILAMMIIFMVGFGLSATQAQANKYASIVIEEATGKVLFFAQCR